MNSKTSVSVKAEKVDKESATKELKSWASGRKTLLAWIKYPSLAGPPPGEPSTERLTTLIECLTAHRWDDSEGKPGKAAATKLAHAAKMMSEKLPELAETAVSEIASEIDRCVLAGVSIPEVLATQSFGQDGVMLVSGISEADDKLVLAVGLANKLPPSIRKLIPLSDGECFQLTLRGMSVLQPGLILGRPDTSTLAGAASARNWYLTTETVRLTEFFRAQQKRKEAERANEARLAEYRSKVAEEQYGETIAGRISYLERELSKLRSRQSAKV